MEAASRQGNQNIKIRLGGHVVLAVPVSPSTRSREASQQLLTSASHLPRVLCGRMEDRRSYRVHRLVPEPAVAGLFPG
jgi:hypothetical protein